MSNSVEQVKDILSRCLFVPKDKIDDDASVSAINGLDSLTFETIILEIEKLTGKNVDPAKLMDVRTVKELAAVVESMK